MTNEQKALEESYQDLQRITQELVEVFAIPHTRMCMRWGRPTREAYREEIANWLRDYGKSFVRIPDRALPGQPSLRAFARTRLDAEIAVVVQGGNRAVEESYEHLFA